MKINKRIALFMLVINALYILFGVASFFRLGGKVFKDFSEYAPQQSQLEFYLSITISAILSLIIYIGLFWGMKVFKEKKWVKSGLVVFFCIDAFVILWPFAMYFYHTPQVVIDMELITHLLIKVNTLYLLFTFAFVRNRTIRRYYWGFAGLMLLCHLVSYFGPVLYDDYGYAWLVINDDVIFYIPFLCSLTLFVEIFNLSRQQNLANIEIETTGLTE